MKTLTNTFRYFLVMVFFTCNVLAQKDLTAPSYPVSDFTQEQEELTETKPPVIDFIYLTAPMVEIPNKMLMPNMGINVAASFGLTLYPWKSLPLGFNLNTSFGGYSRTTETKKFYFDDFSTPTVLDIKYYSRMNKILFGIKLINYKSSTFFKPYITAQIGYAYMRSRIYIPDPDDEDDCAPIENRIVHKSRGLVYGGELGFELNLTSKHLRKEKGYKGQGIHFFASTSILKGFDNIEYINIKHMKDKTHGPIIHSHHHNENKKDKDIIVDFINISSNTVHHHKVAELYRTPLQFRGISAGLVMRF
jgi:hypothetical protein